ncbi:hypothetical protein MMC30_003944 [Trapelia coarctata]|nr:hypothetical protein [Trapelia coarctata]
MLIASLFLLPIALLSVLAKNPLDIGKMLGMPNPPPPPHTYPLDCLTTGIRPPLRADCDAAIALIPSGGLFFDPDRPGTSKTIDLYLPNRRRFLLPAIFHSGTCLVAVDPDRNEPPTSQVLANPASAMYFVIWPNVRSQAEWIVRWCLNTPYTGGTELAQSMLGNFSFAYMVTVMAVPEGFPDHGTRAYLSRGSGLKRHILYNLYRSEGGGSVLGPAHSFDFPEDKHRRMV